MNVIEEIFIELGSGKIIAAEFFRRKVYVALSASSMNLNELQSQRVCTCIVQDDDLDELLEELNKRLDKQRFHWPDWFSEESLCLSIEQLDQSLDGYNLNGMRPHRTISTAHII